MWFLIPHRSTFVSSTPTIKLRLKYPTYWILFFIPLCSVFVFNTPTLEFGFLNPMCDFRFVKVNLVLLFLNVYYIIQKIVKFLSEMSVFCQNLWYNVYSDNFRAGCSRIITSPPFLFMVIPPLRPISRIGLFFLYQPRELSWTVHQLSNTFSILYDSLLFFQHK